MIRNTITKAGFQGQREDGGLELDYSDACDLMALPAWNRYFVRKLLAKREELKEELANLESCDIIEFKTLQAKISLIGELVKIPEIDVKNLKT